MTEPKPTPQPGETAPPPNVTPGATPRRLDRAPGERYRGAGGSAPGSTAGAAPGLPPESVASKPVWGANSRFSPSPVRALVFSVPPALILAAVFVWLAGPLSFTSGLVLLAIVTGSVVGIAVRIGAGRLGRPRRRVAIALAVTLLWFAVSQVGTWQFALSEGGDLPLVEYLAQVYGPLVFIELIAAGLAAAWTAR